MTEANLSNELAELCAGVDAALDDPELKTWRERAEIIRPAMERLVGKADSVPKDKKQPYKGGAAGHLLHADPDGRYHILAVVFPEGTSSGVHFHGCWGVIGYMHGSDEETRFRPVSGCNPGEMVEVGAKVELVETSKHIWHQGDVTFLLPPEEGWHRVRNQGPGIGVSIHVLCKTPPKHPHLYWDPKSRIVLDFPFYEAEPDVWRAEVSFPDEDGPHKG